MVNRLDSLFSLDDEELLMIEVNKLLEFEDHIFPGYDENSMKSLMKSIESRGVVTPILVRKHPKNLGKYEILAGHNRVEACKRLNIDIIPARLFNDLSEDDAKMIVIETNLNQRNLNDFKVSERAHIVSEWDRLRNDKDIEKENEEFSNESGLNLGRIQVWRYNRIHNCLIQEIKNLLDNYTISIKAGVELSYLDEDGQMIVLSVLNEGYKLTESKASLIKNLFEENQITKEAILDLFIKKKKERKPFKIKPEILDNYFTKETDTEIQKILVEALDKYFNKKEGSE
ncbi:ParB/RepB/Spo0J family partition protein [Acetobacterium wieringae]|jgi:ParB family chromosome partitioning protein|uniref:Nucleoid occlusion protein n=1 Tax=Acetobacterium wieringae TaxID=52694 RepID=A0A1F2PLI0_9FIRM|nr:ParB/RepB/Spo0J family partition protein [Acetobacterium wieringae]OFV71536.1 nucleoid occlusion protein [Acetobacterium wieringae]